MAVDIDGILDALVSHAAATGYLDQVNQHEPTNQSSGLDSTSVLMVFNLRLYTSTLQEPQDAIDPEMVRVIDALFTAYIGDFTLGGLVRGVDVRGIEGPPLDGQAGYLKQDEVLYRVFTITLPVVVNDAWDEEA
jgi:hypothetical protein